MILWKSRKWLFSFAFGGRPDRLSWWQHLTVWLVALSAVSVPAVWLPVMRQSVAERTVATCPWMPSSAAYSTPPPADYALPEGCVCAVAALDDVTSRPSAGRSAIDDLEVDACSLLRYRRAADAG